MRRTAVDGTGTTCLVNGGRPVSGFGVMMYRITAVLLAIVGMFVIGAPTPAHADPYDDFGLAKNAEDQACRGVWRFESAKPPTAIDVYCGQWQSPSGTLRLTRS